MSSSNASLARVAVGVHIVAIALACVFVWPSIAGFLGGTLMIVTAIFAIVTWGILAALEISTAAMAVKIARGTRTDLDTLLDWTRGLLLTTGILAVVTAFLFGFASFATCAKTWLPPLYHWGGLVGSVLAFVAYYLMPWVVRAHLGTSHRHAEPWNWKHPFIAMCVLYGVWALVWLIAWLVLRGSIDESAYPARASSPYRLPFPAGESAWVIQGNLSSFNHDDHAWDFVRECGTPVLAARAGTVTDVEDSHDGNGGSSPNNAIEIRHSDGTVGRYLHIQQGSARVSPGDAVTQAEPIANVGNVGNSLTGHVHFVVESGGNSLPVSFNDVEDDAGIPRTFSSYTSGNR